MSKHIKPGELGAALEETLTLYSEEVDAALAGVISESIDDLVRRTKDTAPRKTGRFRKQIAAEKKALSRRGGGGGLRGRTLRATWYVKAPDYRRTHLLVHGHATRNGGRTKGDPFLQKALDEVLPEYERKVAEVLANGK